MARRKDKKPEDNKIKWINDGGGAFRAIIDGKERIIKPNETFHASVNEVPEGFRDTIRPLDPDQVPKEMPNSVQQATEVEFEETEYEKHHVGGGWYDVFDTEGNKMNEVKLKAEDADNLIKALKG